MTTERPGDRPALIAAAAILLAATVGAVGLVTIVALLRHIDLFEQSEA